MDRNISRSIQKRRHRGPIAPESYAVQQIRARIEREISDKKGCVNDKKQ